MQLPFSPGNWNWGWSRIIVQPSQKARGHGEAKWESVPSRLPNNGLQATANSLRSCLASAIGGA
jgi:hypothetical protein